MTGVLFNTTVYGYGKIPDSVLLLYPMAGRWQVYYFHWHRRLCDALISMN